VGVHPSTQDDSRLSLSKFLLVAVYVCRIPVADASIWAIYWYRSEYLSLSQSFPTQYGCHPRSCSVYYSQRSEDLEDDRRSLTYFIWLTIDSAAILQNHKGTMHGNRRWPDSVSRLARMLNADFLRSRIAFSPWETELAFSWAQEREAGPPPAHTLKNQRRTSRRAVSCCTGPCRARGS